MTQREQFEAAMRRLADQPESSFETPYGDNDDANAHWAVWQASRRAALEEAAKAIEPRNPPEDWTGYARIRAYAADEIRALAASDSDKGT